MFNEKFERSWMVSGFPKDLTPFDGYTIKKTYLDLDENEGAEEIRLLPHHLPGFP